MQDIKQAYQSAKKELDEEVKRKLIDDMKGYIQNTLQAIEDKKQDIAENQQELKALKADLNDLQEGRLDKIKERQDKDPISRRVSVIIITKIINNYPSIQQYFQPYFPRPSLGWGGTYAVKTTLLNTAYNSADVSGTYTINSLGGTKAFYVGSSGTLIR